MFRAKSVKKSLPAIAAVILMLGGCATQPSDLITKISLPLIPFSIPLPNIFFFLSSDVDLTGKSWTEAFSLMHERLAKEYPYTEWKQVNWDALEAEFGGRIAAAEAEGNPEAYYLALREYLYAIPDSHLGISVREDLRSARAGASLGFVAVPLADGRVVAQAIAPGSPAEEAGVRPGAELLTWNGTAFPNAVTAASTSWDREPFSTDRSRHLSKLRMLLRMPAGTTVTLGWRNPGDSTTLTASLNAVADGFSAYEKMYPRSATLGESGSPLEFRMLDVHAGYIRLLAIAPNLDTPFPERAFDQALQKLMLQGATRLVLDVRGTSAGVDNLVPLLAGHFVTGKEAPELLFYEDVAALNPRTGEFETTSSLQLRVMPRSPHFQGAVSVLVDNDTMGAAEGLAMLLQRLPQVDLLGFEATRGSAGITGGSISLPEEISVYYPTGRSQDAAGAVQLESDASGAGGLAPDVRPTLDAGVAERIYERHEDVLLQLAQEHVKARQAALR